MNKLLFEQPKLRLETFYMKEDVLITSSISLGEDETDIIKIPAAIGNGNVYN